MTVLHLFDLYLPQTMNWAWRLMRATPNVEQWVAAPWMLRNEYHSPDFRFFTRPFQQKTGWLPTDEGRAEWFSGNLVRAERRWPLYQNWLFQQLKNNRPDVLHAHFAPIGCQYLEMAERLDIPLVVSFYGFDYERLPFEKPAYRERYHQLFQRAAAITTTGELTPRLLEKQGCLPEKITPIPLSISPAEFPFFERKKESRQLRLVQIATITEKKGHLDTLAAFKLALQHCPNIHLTLAGERQDKSLFRKIQNFIQGNGLKGNVTLRDFIPHHELPQFLSQFDVFIHPSRRAENRDCEGAPVAILEALSMGLPVIATEHSDIPRQVLHRKTGFLAAERNPEMLRQFIEQFYYMGNDEYQQMSRAAHAHVEQNFDVRDTGKKLRALYQSIHSS